VAQDFWASSGYRLLERDAGGLHVSDAWLAHQLAREELVPPDEAGPVERALHARLIAAPRAPVTPSELARVEDADARDNWGAWLALRERLLQHGTIESAYASLFVGDVAVAPVFVDLLARVIVRDLLEGEADAWLARAGELFFRLQRVSTEGGRALCADAATLEMYSESGGLGNVGRLLREQGMRLPEVRMDVLNEENAPFYFLRDELHSFVFDVTAGARGAQALATMLSRWVARMTGARVVIEPLDRVEDERWSWHVGLDAESSAILDALYRGESLAAERLERLVLLFRLEFLDPAQVSAPMWGRTVYLGLARREDRTLRMKPQNLLANLPLAPSRPGRLGRM